MVREQAIRLLPQVPVGTTATTSGYTLVNLQTIFWAPTNRQRDLGVVTVTGVPVHLRATFSHATWTFGDTTTDQTQSPGSAYVPHSCTTAMCPDYYGHVYTAAGTKTVQLAVAWACEYGTDNGTTWQPVDPVPLAGPPATATITVYQTRAHLVAQPSGR